MFRVYPAFHEWQVCAHGCDKGALCSSGLCAQTVVSDFDGFARVGSFILRGPR